MCRPLPIRPFWRALILVGSLFLAGCGGSGDGAQPSSAANEFDPTTSSAAVTTTDGRQPAASTTGAPASTAPPTSTAPDSAIELVVGPDGAEGGPRREEVALGDEITIRVSSTVIDEIHVHGYDVTADLTEGEVTELRFVASIPGVFEVELEGRGHLLLNLEVS